MCEAVDVFRSPAVIFDKAALLALLPDGCNVIFCMPQGQSIVKRTKDDLYKTAAI